MIRYYSFKDFLLIAIVISIGIFVVLFLHGKYGSIPVEPSDPVKTVPKVNIQIKNITIQLLTKKMTIQEFTLE